MHERAVESTGPASLPPAKRDQERQRAEKPEKRDAGARYLHFHEAYHLGQLGLLRRLCGLPRFA